MHKLLDLESFPLNRPDSREYKDLATRCRADLMQRGMFNLDGLVRPETTRACVAGIAPLMATEAFRHERLHNIYFRSDIPELPADHPALHRFKTSNSTLCADQLAGSDLLKIYNWRPLVRFLAAIMGKRRLYPMGDPLARVNVMSYQAGEALNWHFDRAEFTTTLLLQRPDHGGEFEYRTGLRSETDANYDGVARLLKNRDRQKQRLELQPGTLNVFRGRNTAHRVTKVEGETPRMIAVFSYFEQAGAMLTEKERIGFYGRAA